MPNPRDLDITPTLSEAIREMANDGTVRTHSESCWQWHLPCAAMYAAAMIEDLEPIAKCAIDVVRGCEDDCDDDEWDKRWTALQLAVLSDDEVTPDPEWGPDSPGFDEMGQ